MSEDWFRAPAWDAASRDDFREATCPGPPAQPPQYLRIKALALRNAGEIQAAKTLLLRVLDQPGVYPFEVACTHELLGDLAAQQGDRQAAGNYYALELASRGPQLVRHKDVGLVHADDATLLRLRDLAT